MFCHGLLRCGEWYARPDDAVAGEAVPVGAGRAPDVRVSQAERDEVVGVLGRHYADGRLAMGEYEERAEAAMAARTGHDLDVLLTDLPAVPAAAPAAARRSPWPAGGWRRVSPYLPRIVAVTAVVALAVGNGLWVLWLLWPALALTSVHRPHDRPEDRGHRPRPPRPARGHRAGPATDWM